MFEQCAMHALHCTKLASIFTRCENCCCSKIQKLKIKIIKNKANYCHHIYSKIWAASKLWDNQRQTLVHAILKYKLPISNYFFFFFLYPILHSTQYTVHSTHCTVHSTHCTVHSTQYTQCSGRTWATVVRALNCTLQGRSSPIIEEGWRDKQRQRSSRLL